MTPGEQLDARAGALAVAGDAPIRGHDVDRFAGTAKMTSFGPFVAHVREHVDAHLERWLEARVAAAGARGEAVEAVAGALMRLVLRGGKRMRAVLLAAAFEACGGGEGEAGDAVVAAGASLELLQAYLLVHDDWM